MYALTNEGFVFNSDIPKPPKPEPPVPETKETSPERNSKKEREKEKEKTRQRSPSRSKSRSRSRSRSPSHSRPRRRHRSRSRWDFSLSWLRRLRSEYFLLKVPLNVMFLVQIAMFLRDVELWDVSGQMRGRHSVGKCVGGLFSCCQFMRRCSQQLTLTG